jgi:transcriptional regulator with XRE-family HTH domain
MARKFGRLREQIKNVFGTQRAFADAMGINAATINAKLNGKADWNLSEIEKACGLLRVPADEINEYFFY